MADTPPPPTHTHAAVCKANPRMCTRLAATQTQCGDLYIHGGRLLQYPEDRPAQNCVNMCVAACSRWATMRVINAHNIAVYT
jgi:hypothetical protein